MSNWQPIDTAPLDKWILTAGRMHTQDGQQIINMSRFSLDDRCFMMYDQWPDYDATHWMPLPELPK